MSELYRDIEYSNQSVPLQAVQVPLEERALSRNMPLFDLEAEMRPAIPVGDKHDTWNTVFPLSNDSNSGPMYRALRVRETSPDYQRTAHPVALIVGEGSLAAALPYIPEPTILMIDQQPTFLRYMQRYIARLRTTRLLGDFKYELGLGNIGYLVVDHMLNWDNQDDEHPLKSQEAFRRSAELARRKAIVPYRIDLTDAGQVRDLGELLRRYGATVTFMNLTNVAGYMENFGSARHLHHNLSHLPVTETAPIMTTTSTVSPGSSRYGNGDSENMPQTGPFWGLRNLREAGDTITDLTKLIVKETWPWDGRTLAQGALFHRQYIA